MINTLKSIIKRISGFDETNWLRVEQIRSWRTLLDEQKPRTVLEVSPGWNSMWSSYGDYRSVQFPEFNICEQALDRRFDAVIADQVLEHVPNPVAAIRNMSSMLQPGGHMMIATPFLFRVHGRPADFFRWTESGMRQLLLDAGANESEIRVFSWGNAACARAHTRGPVRSFGFGRDLSNDPEYPMMVWAFVRKP